MAKWNPTAALIKDHACRQRGIKEQDKLSKATYQPGVSCHHCIGKQSKTASAAKPNANAAQIELAQALPELASRSARYRRLRQTAEAAKGDFKKSQRDLIQHKAGYLGPIQIEESNQIERATSWSCLVRSTCTAIPREFRRIWSCQPVGQSVQ